VVFEIDEELSPRPVEEFFGINGEVEIEGGGADRMGVIDAALEIVKAFGHERGAEGEAGICKALALAAPVAGKVAIEGRRRRLGGGERLGEGCRRDRQQNQRGDGQAGPVHFVAGILRGRGKNSRPAFGTSGGQALRAEHRHDFVDHRRQAGDHFVEFGLIEAELFECVGGYFLAAGGEVERPVVFAGDGVGDVDEVDQRVVAKGGFGMVMKADGSLVHGGEMPEFGHGLPRRRS